MKCNDCRYWEPSEVDMAKGHEDGVILSGKCLNLDVYDRVITFGSSDGVTYFCADFGCIFAEKDNFR